MCYVDNEGRLAAVGTVLQVQDYALVQVSVGQGCCLTANLVIHDDPSMVLASQTDQGHLLLMCAV
jgi:hypothetical protein